MRNPRRSAKRKTRATRAFERALFARRREKCILRLYVAGASARSAHAIQRVRRMCEEELAPGYELQVIDVYQQPHLACAAQIVATPTLVRLLPTPVRRLIGDLTNVTHLFVGSGLAS